MSLHQNGQVIFGQSLSFNKWNYKLRGVPTADEISWKQPVEFSHVTKLIEEIWVDPQLWERIIGYSLVIIKHLDKSMSELLEQPNNETARKYEDTFYEIDLRLKQLARYLLCEMKRQKLEVPAGI